MDMLDEIKGIANQFQYALTHYQGLKFNLNGIQHIHLAGMGGSALPADLVNDYLSDINPSKQIRITRDYQLPKDVSPNDLVICSSYSGNTEETLESLEDALSKMSKIVVLSHGGKLKEAALKNKLPLIEIPTCIQPRCAVGYFFSALLMVLESAGWINDSVSVIKQLEALMQAKALAAEDEGKKIAQFLKDKLPLIYGPTSLAAVLKIFKIKLNENAKVQAFYNVYPELNHNEMVGFTKLITKPGIVQFRSQFMHPRIGLRMDVIKKVLGQTISFYDVELKGQDLLEEIFLAHTIADYASYYLAREYGMDPAPVEMVEEFKRLL
ncbi:MAG: hypothetical protein ACD_73C00446G0002 [uncultured bacterium]|nr:MAG: hypothetical protein ACD_73C00446G0002 [uncultured bacterium]